ncbi:signal recognition particle-docking protein FtsY [Tenebrionibacter intestinalis]|jgi:fused signal recognition particle receptor|uniref:Signal recognition particle receptor FtsY n=1 Tax=Tenebrionibacter intestinalis TaxID=2799638 RepID=A0A8K0V1M4_9ENTR|nr:signal recognition particle-docking protein FtsY [Tenebrionibacter intestinalis]MBK4715298.1 signal recognition particle-docking protein FtsY [Tenebrionibacter intestinalis]
MAKEKKKGFFSWLGFGQKAQPDESVTTQIPGQDSPEQPAADDAATPHTQAESDAFAKDIVNISQQAVESEKRQQESARNADDSVAGLQADVWQAVQASIVEEEAVVAQEELKAQAARAARQEEEEKRAEQARIAQENRRAEARKQADEEARIAQEAVLAAEKAAFAAEQKHQAEEAARHAQEAKRAEDEATRTLKQAEGEKEQTPPNDADALATHACAPAEQEKPTKDGFFARLKRSLIKTRQNLGSGFVGLFRGKKIDDDLFEELEEQLLIADVGVETTRKIIQRLTESASRQQLRDAEALYGLLKDEMGGILAKADEPLNIEGRMPFVILMVGVNGVGKTTTIGKLARQFQQQGKTVMLAAGDTFRAAAVEQLQIWGQRNDIPVVAQHTGADSASVIFDAIQAAKARNVDVLIADTAGRLQNKSHLMEELKKIVRVMKKLDEDAPHEVMLTIDASTGQNAISQTKLFHEAVGLTGITLTKLDGTAKGGVIFSVADRFGIPIRYIGVGERIEDLRAFNAGDFIEALFARED